MVAHGTRDREAAKESRENEKKLPFFSWRFKHSRFNHNFYIDYVDDDDNDNDIVIMEMVICSKL